MKVWHIIDFGGQLLSSLVCSKNHIPKPLPWIEPSINCLHQEATLSLLVGNAESAIMCTGALLEHVLRLAIVNKDECGLKRPESVEKMDQFQSLTKVVDAAVDTDVFDGCNEQWWRAVAKIRNKSAHYLLPILLRKCAEDAELKKYIIEYELPEKSDDWYYKHYITDWGSFYHKAGYYLAYNFLYDATEQIKIVISNTNWVGDESWWISQKQIYEDFFKYSWTVENIKSSFENAFSEFGRHKDEE